MRRVTRVLCPKAVPFHHQPSEQQSRVGAVGVEQLVANPKQLICEFKQPAGHNIPCLMSWHAAGEHPLDMPIPTPGDLGRVAGQQIIQTSERLARTTDGLVDHPRHEVQAAQASRGGAHTRALGDCIRRLY